MAKRGPRNGNTKRELRWNLPRQSGLMAPSISGEATTWSTLWMAKQGSWDQKVYAVKTDSEGLAKIVRGPCVAEMPNTLAVHRNNSQKKAALGPNRSSTARRLPILFESTLAGSLSRSMSLVRHLSSEPLIATPKGADWVKALTPKDRLPSWSVD